MEDHIYTCRSTYVYVSLYVHNHKPTTQKSPIMTLNFYSLWILCIIILYEDSCSTHCYIIRKLARSEVGEAADLNLVYSLTVGFSLD